MKWKWIALSFVPTLLALGLLALMPVAPASAAAAPPAQGITPTVTITPSFTSYTVDLPSGGVAAVEMRITAGEVMVTAGLGGLAVILLFGVLRDVAHVMSKR